MDHRSTRIGNRHRSVVLLGAFTLLAVFVGPATPPVGAVSSETTPASPGFFRIINQNSGQCLAVQTDAERAPAIQVTCAPGYADQVWVAVEILLPSGVIVHRLENWNSGKCLVVQGHQPGARAFQTRCSSSYEYADQLWWAPNIGGPGSFKLQNWNSQQCLVVQGDWTGSPAFQYYCGPFADQWWVASPVDVGP